MVRLNITLPEEIVKRIASKKNKSRFIADALREKLEREKKQEIECLLLEGYKAAAKEDAKFLNDWEGVDLDEWD